MNETGVDDCPMTEECPGYDRDRAVCLIRPGDCAFSPARADPARAAGAAAPAGPTAAGGTAKEA